MNMLTRRLITGVATAGLLIGAAGIATADNVANEVAADSSATFTAGGSATVQFKVNANGGDGQSGCNAADGSSATLTLDAPSGVTATPATLVFTACNAFQNVVFSSATPGDYSWIPSISDSGLGEYSVHSVSLTVLPATPSDTTPPEITPNVSGTLGNNGWYTSDVTVTWTVEDNESAITSSTGCGLTTTSTDTTGTALTCTATSAGGTSSESVTIKRDATAPTVVCPTTAPAFLLNQSPASVVGSFTDATSGPTSGAASAPADTSSIGSKTVTLSATDDAGNVGSSSACGYRVGYAFSGFTSPVDNAPVLNNVKAGQAVPLKWRITDANGIGVTNLTSVSLGIAGLSCLAGTTVDELEEYAAGNSGLQNLGDGFYQYNWKTPTTYANSCKTMTLNLGDGDTTHTALFKFKK